MLRSYRILFLEALNCLVDGVIVILRIEVTLRLLGHIDNIENATISVGHFKKQLDILVAIELSQVLIMPIDKPRSTPCTKPADASKK